MLRRIVFLAALFCCGLVRAETITVSAALSLKEALNDIVQQYSADTNDQVNLIFGNSVTLAGQIEKGASVDLYITAVNKPMDDGYADPATRTPVALNRLVLIVPANSKNPPHKFEDLADGRFARIAIADPKTVGMGEYAMQTFAALHLDATLAPRLVLGQNVRDVLIDVSLGQVDAGVVYVTDAALAPKTVTVAAIAPENSHDPIVYSAAVMKAGKADAAAKFLNYLQSDKVRAILTARGFGVPQSTTRPA
jgi:molybdate transport system substrate-binding protein